MTKRYRRPKVKDSQIKIQMGNLGGNPEIVFYAGNSIDKCDQWLLLDALCEEGESGEKSLVEELEDRGYDLNTLRLSIEKNVL